LRIQEQFNPTFKSEAHLNIAAGTKEEKNSLEETERAPALSLVPRTGSRSTNRAFRIGISDDVFARVDHRRRGPLSSAGTDRQEKIGGDVDDRKTDIRAIRRLDPIMLFAAAGAILGYLLGRYSRGRQ
jgi:hypothetical protein